MTASGGVQANTSQHTIMMKGEKRQQVWALGRGLCLMSYEILSESRNLAGLQLSKKRKYIP